MRCSTLAVLGAIAAVAGCGHGASGSATPATTAHRILVMCGSYEDVMERDVFATSDDGRTLRRVTTDAGPSGLAAASGIAVFAYTNGQGDNGVAKFTGAATSPAPQSVPVAPAMAGIPRLSHDGRKLAYVVAAQGAGDRLEDAVVVSDLGGRHRRVVAQVSAVNNMDFDGSGGLRVLGAVRGGGSYITAPDSSRTAEILRRRTAVIRYSGRGDLALSGLGWAEVRDAAGRVVARRRGLVVLGWDLGGARVLVRRADRRVAWWDVARNTLATWPRLSCGFPAEAAAE